MKHDPKAELSDRKHAIMIVEDHVVVREGFAALVNREEDLRVCAQTASAPEAMSMAMKYRPDLVIVDLILKDGDGLSLIKSLRARYSDVLILVVSMQDEEIYAERSLRAGAMGYVMKHAATEEFITAIRTVLKGDIFISRKMNARFLDQYIKGGSPSDANECHELSDREIQVFRLLGSGAGTREISTRLGISPKTVETHRENIKTKLDISNAAELVSRAMKWVNESV